MEIVKCTWTITKSMDDYKNVHWQNITISELYEPFDTHPQHKLALLMVAHRAQFADTNAGRRKKQS